MKKIRDYFWTLAAIFIFTSCGNDNYDAPAETFQGAFIDKDTNEPIQTAASTAIEHGGIRIRLMEYSWSDNPVPYDFFAKRDGTFNNTKIFKGTYGIIPEGPFVPLPEEIIDLEGVVKKNYFVEPLLRVQWVGEPVLKDDGTFEVQVKITRGTDNPDYQQPLEEAWLFVSQIDYVSNAPGAYSTKLSTNLTQADLRNYTLGDILTIRTGYPNGWNGGTGDPQKIDGSYKRPYFLRFGARTSKSFSSIKRYNFTDVKEVWVGK